MNAPPPLLVLVAAGWGVAYALGCVNTGYLLVRARTGRDIRTLGSGNAGARNVGRVFGRGGFAATLVGDLLKGVAAVMFGRWMGLESLALGATALFVVAGHNWPAPLGFRGGKGVAASCGALLALDLALAGVLVGIALVLLFATRRFTLSGLAAYAVAPGVALLLNRPPEFAALLGGLALLVLLPHHHELRAIVMPGRICRPSSPPTPTPSP